MPKQVALKFLNSMLDEDKLKDKIIAVLLEYPDGYTNKTIDRLIDVFYESISRKRTSAQNKAIHRDMSIIAEKLNDAKYDVRKTIKVSIPFTTQLVKDYIWRPIQKKMFQKESTTELDKSSGEIEKLHDVIMRELGEKLGIEYHPFPRDEKKAKEYEESITGNYPGPAETPLF